VPQPHYFVYKIWWWR